MNIVKMKVSDLIPYINNPRNNENAVDKVASSIKEFGFKVPIVIDKNNVIVNGHTRLLASKKLGLEEVPVIVADDLSDAQIKAFRIADNKVSEYASWDEELLKLELEQLEEMDFDLDLVNIDYSDFDLEIELEEIDVDFENKKQKNDDFYYFDREEIINDNIKEFKKYDTVEDYVKNIMNIPKAKYEFNRLCQGYQAGYNISLLFNPHRLDTETIKSKSIFYAINNDEKYKKEFSRYIVNVQNKVTTENEFYKFISIGNAGYQYVNEFPPYLARDIYKKYCKDGDKILNPCAGWGGRLLGIASSMLKNVEYVETDPSIKTYEGLLRLKEFLNLDNRAYKTFNKPFEELELEESYFDFAFTSPPYFDTEKYANEETQSFKRSDNYEQWKKNFLEPMLDKLIYTLKNKGKCLLNVGKVRYPIDTDIIEYLKTKNIKVDRIKDFSIGGNGIGARTDEEGSGEPFLLFENKK